MTDLELRTKLYWVCSWFIHRAPGRDHRNARTILASVVRKTTGRLQRLAYNALVKSL